jgi:hypothetical protein
LEQLVAQGNGLRQVHAHRTLGVQPKSMDSNCLGSNSSIRGCLSGRSGRCHSDTVAEQRTSASHLGSAAQIGGNRARSKSNPSPGAVCPVRLYRAEIAHSSNSLRRESLYPAELSGPGSIVGVRARLLPIRTPIRLGAYHEGMTVSRKPLLAPGNEAEWAQINSADAEQLRASNLALTPVQRLELGQRLSQQAVSLLAASVKAGNAPRRALWS